MSLQADFPEFLESYGKFVSHLSSQLTGLTSYEIGNRFALFVEKLVPHSDIGNQFEHPQKRQHSHDEGVDFEAKSKDGLKRLFIQSKYTIKKLDDIDNVFSKFRSFDAKNDKSNLQLPLGFDEECSTSDFYMLVTSSDIKSLLAKYTSSNRPSVRFFQDLMTQNRVSFLYGEKLYDLLKQTFAKSHIPPSKVCLNFGCSVINYDNVYIGVVSISEIRKLYHKHGDALFLENIREWLGYTSSKEKSEGVRETPNQAIAQTLSEAPSRFLARNNGITFRSTKVVCENESTLCLDEASIVNGCQTTMAIAKQDNEYGNVLVKIVETVDSWDIAKAANFQNQVSRIELELARELRPQLIRKIASKTGYSFTNLKDNQSAFAVLDVIYDDKVIYEELKSLFIGLFSRSPNNCLENNYTELKQNLLDELQSSENHDLYETLFAIHVAARKAFEEIENLNIKQEIHELFQRFWKEEKYSYRAFLAILAMGYVVDENIYNKESSLNSIKIFLHRINDVLDLDMNKFIKAYHVAFRTIALDVMKPNEDKQAILQGMYKNIKDSRYDNLLYRMSLVIG